MYDKSYYRTVFTEMKPYIKLTCYCEELGIHKGNFSRFMKGNAYDDVLSIQSLESLYDVVIKSLNKFL